MLKTSKILIFIGIIFIGFSCTEKEYPSGRDTARSFGDGRFQILWGKSDIKVLHDCKTQRTILREIQNWDKDGDIIYVIGSKDQLFTVLNFVTAEVQQYNTTDNIPDTFKDKYHELVWNSERRLKDKTN